MVILCAIVVGWVVLGTFCLIDLQIGNRLYFPTVSYDYQLRTAITSSFLRVSLRPFASCAISAKSPIRK